MARGDTPSETAMPCVALLQQSARFNNRKEEGRKPRTVTVIQLQLLAQAAESGVDCSQAKNPAYGAVPLTLSWSHL